MRSHIDEDGIDHADIDELALAGLVGAEDGAEPMPTAHMVAGIEVADAGADLHRRVLVRAGDGHDAAEGLRMIDVVGRPVGIGAGAGATIAEAADGGVDQLRDCSHAGSRS